MSLRAAAALAAAAFLVLPIAALSTTIHVPGDQPTIQAGIDAAAAGDTVLVACGTYMEDNIAMKSGVIVASETGLPTCATVVSGTHRHFVALGLGPGTALLGFTLSRAPAGQYGGGITCSGSVLSISNCRFDALRGGGLSAGGSAITLEGCVFENNTATSGAGLSAYESSVVLSGCEFRSNLAPHVGGAVYGSSSQLLIDECDFEWNQSPGGYGYAGWGGAVYGEESDVEISDARFHANSAKLGGAVYCSHGDGTRIVRCEFRENTAFNNNAGKGGALFLWESATTIIQDATFESNASERGGALYLLAEPSVLIENSQFADNRAGLYGGAVSSAQCNGSLSGAVFRDNLGEARGGALFLANSSWEVTRSTFVGGAASSGSAIQADNSSALAVNRVILAFGLGGVPVGCVGASVVEVFCSDVFGNGSGDWIGCIDGQANINGNFSADPLFCDPENGDFTIRSNSPCAPPGVTGCGLVGALPVGCGPVSVERESWAGIKSRYREVPK